MDFFQIKDIAETGIELLNPISAEKIIAAGEVAGLGPHSRVIEFGSGVGEVLALWGERFGIHGVGIDIRQTACERARQKMAARGLSSQVDIVCMDGAQYPFEPHAYDLAACVGATFIWDDFQTCLRRLREALAPGGRLIIGEVSWRASSVPVEFFRQMPFIHSEYELLKGIRQEGCELEYLVRADEADWARYEAGNWRGLLKWLEANPTHPERDQIIKELHDSQDEYTRFGREYLAWALYILKPAG